MTREREEAIDIFEHNWTRLVNPDYTEEELNKAFGIALKALEQEACGDAISRQAVIDEMCKRYSVGDMITLGFIQKLPSVNPQKTGHWEYGYSYADGNYCKCSECKEIIKCIYPMHYCPNCGAKMESEET